jgi:electron transfer flavoprotein beta subunit
MVAVPDQRHEESFNYLILGKNKGRLAAGSQFYFGASRNTREIFRRKRTVINEKCPKPRLEVVNIVVCAKQIPDPSAPQSLDAQNNLNRSGKLLLDEADTYGVEMALQLAEASGGEVVVVSMGDATDLTGLRTALAMGAARAIVVSDPALRGADALDTASVLSAVISSVSPDLVLTATESSDGYTGTIPAQIAELLGWPSVTFAKSLAGAGDKLRVTRQSEAGFDEVAVSLPAVVSVTAGVVEPRYASFKGIMAAKSKPVEVKSLSDLGITLIGGQAINSVNNAPSRQAGEKFVDDGTAAEKIVAFLESVKAI